MIFDKLVRNGNRNSLTVIELRAILGHMQTLYVAAGAKTAAKELQVFSDMLKPYSDVDVFKACADIKLCLSQAPEKAVKRGKGTSRSNAAPPSGEDAIQRHLGELRSAGSDQTAFDLALKNLKASKSVKAADLSEIARQFSRSVTKYKSKAAAYADIENAFVRHARFENKLA
jgi:hypothetical protein